MFTKILTFVAIFPIKLPIFLASEVSTGFFKDCSDPSTVKKSQKVDRKHSYATLI